MARRSKRSVAARKGWETRRRKAAEQAALAAKRSAAAKKGWQTRKSKTKPKTAVVKRIEFDPDDYEEEDIEFAELWGVHPQDVEDLRDVVDFGDWTDPSSAAWDHGRLADYIDDLADAMGVEQDDLWDVWWTGIYGGTREAA